MSASRFVCFALAGVVGSFVSAHAALLGVVPGFPTLVYDNSGVMTYDSATDLFVVDAFPLAIRFTPFGLPILVVPTGNPAMERFFIQIHVDDSGNLVGGVAGDDLVVIGQVDQDGDTIPDFTGVLLTGEAAAFGFREKAGPNALFDFRFAVTGGAMASEFGGGAIGVLLTSESSSFSGSFSQSFAGFAKGTMGPIDFRCGDGFVDGGEQCDDGEGNSDTEPNACRTNCTLAGCGDGVVDTGEQCDDANAVDTDCCTNLCALPTCGDGIVSSCPDSLEGCDDGTDNSDSEPDACRTDCTRAGCGDGVADTGEQCDDGNTDNTDCCTFTCTLPFCGDGFISACPGNIEPCDDANAVDTDCCTNLCAIPRCGDGIVSTCPDNIEACDDGNDIDTDSCSNSCIRNVAAVGCRITGGRYVLDGAQEQGPDAEIIRGQGGGQVGAPCGCIGCFDEFDHIQGQWQYSRKRKQGNFHAREFNSLICGCDQDGACNSDGVNGSAFADSAAFNGQLCNPGEPESGPEPRPSPANVACFSGIGGWAATPGKREIPVAFRVEVEDRGEPAGGEHADGTCDVYQIRIWIPSSGETAAGLADLVCCIDGYDTMGTVRPPDVQDGGNLVHGNIQIHPMTPNSQDGTCPVPDGTCQEP